MQGCSWKSFTVIQQIVCREHTCKWSLLGFIFPTPDRMLCHATAQTLLSVVSRICNNSLMPSAGDKAGQKLQKCVKNVCNGPWFVWHCHESCSRNMEQENRDNTLEVELQKRCYFYQTDTQKYSFNGDSCRVICVTKVWCLFDMKEQTACICLCLCLVWYMNEWS